MKESNRFRIAFSGGGFRASIFCLGAFRRLVSLGISDRVTHIDSVSGGSITAGQIMCALVDGPFKSLQDFDKRVTNPLKKLFQCQLRKKIMRKVILKRPSRR